MYKHST